MTKIIFFGIVAVFTFLIAISIFMRSNKDNLIPIIEKNDPKIDKVFIIILYLFIVYQIFMPIVYWQNYLGDNWGYLIGAAVVLFNGSILVAIIKKDNIIQSYKNKEALKENDL